MEKWDILSFDGEKTGQTVLRSPGALKDGQYHLVVHIWIIDSAGRILIQQRSDDLNILPGKWAITGGSAVSGEDAPEAALRELYEELGVKAEPKELIHIKTYRGRNDFVWVYVLKRNLALSEINMQAAEVQAVKWVTSEELKALVAARKFHNYNYLNEIYNFR